MKCRYCGKEIKRTDGNSWNICDCNKAQKDYDIQMTIQIHEKDIQQLKKNLSELSK